MHTAKARRVSSARTKRRVRRAFDFFRAIELRLPRNLVASFDAGVVDPGVAPHAQPGARARHLRTSSREAFPRLDRAGSVGRARSRTRGVGVRRAVVACR